MMETANKLCEKINIQVVLKSKLENICTVFQWQMMICSINGIQ